MSRGPGRIERTITDLLLANPRKTYTAEEVVSACYPGINRVEKKHRVSTLRAAKKVAANLHWLARTINGTHGSIIFHNALDLRSLAVGMTRAHKYGEPCEVVVPSNLTAEQKRINEVVGRDGYTPFPSSRVAVRWEVLTEEAAVLMLLDGERSPWVKTDGPYPVAVEAHRASAAGDDASELWRDYNKLCEAAVFAPHVITGDIHPDFLEA